MSAVLNSSSRGGFAARLFPAGLVAAIVGVGVYFDHSESFAVAPTQQTAALQNELEREAASDDVRSVAQWTLVTHDHGGLPFVVVDKSQSRIYAFDPQGRLRGSAPVALESGDDKPLPAGRFVAEPLTTTGTAAVVWTNGSTRIAVRSDEPQPAVAGESSLRVAPEFWHECVATLRMQPSVAYVLPQTVPAASVIGDTQGNSNPGRAALASAYRRQS